MATASSMASIRSATSQREIEGGDTFPSSESVSSLPDVSAPKTRAPTRRKRDLLKNYYGLSSTPEASPTLILEMDSATFQPDPYTGNLLRDSTLTELLQKDNELISDIKILDGDMKTLVYENYNRFISASTTVRKMKLSVMDMESEMTKLANNVDQIIQHSENINSSMSGMRAKIHQLSGVHELLQKLGFIFELPMRLRQAVKANQLSQAVAYYSKTSKLLANYRKLSLFQKVEEECSVIMGCVCQKVKENMRLASATPEDICESATLLLLLMVPAEEVSRDFLQFINQPMQRVMQIALQKIQSPRNEPISAENIHVLNKYWLVNIEKVISMYDASFVRSNPCSNLSLAREPSLHLMPNSSNTSKRAVLACQSSSKSANEELKYSFKQELRQLSDKLCQEYMETLVRSFPIINASEPSQVTGLLDWLNVIASDVLNECSTLTRISALDQNLANNIKQNIDDLVVRAFKKCTTLFFETLKYVSGEESLDSQIANNLSRLKQMLVQETMPFLISLSPNSNFHPLLNHILIDKSERGLQIFWDFLADEFLSFKEKEQVEMLEIGQMSKFVLTLSKACFEVSRLLVEDVFVAFQKMSKGQTDLVVISARSTPILRAQGRLSEGLLRSNLILSSPDMLKSREVASKFKLLSRTLIVQYVELRTLYPSQLIQKHIRADNINWLDFESPSGPSPVWDQILKAIEEIDLELMSCVDDDGSIDRKERLIDHKKQSRSPAKTSGSKFDTMFTNIGMLFAERMEYFGKIDFTRPAILMAVIKIFLKCYTEEIRLITMDKEAFAQQQVDLEYLKIHLSQWCNDEKVLLGLLDGAMLAGYSRCLNPREVDGSVLASLINSAPSPASSGSAPSP